MKRIPAHKQPNWPKVRKEIRKLYKPNICRAFVEGHALDKTKDFPKLYCRTCGRTEVMHWLRDLDEALTDAEKG